MGELKSEVIVSGKIESVPNLCVPGDPTKDCLDITSKEAHEAQDQAGNGKTSASNSGTGR